MGDRSFPDPLTSGSSPARPSSKDLPADPPESSVPAVWENASSCGVCDLSFGVFTRKHHCRKCGKTVCSGCSPNQVHTVALPPDISLTHLLWHTRSRSPSVASWNLFACALDATNKCNCTRHNFLEGLSGDVMQTNRLNAVNLTNLRQNQRGNQIASAKDVRRSHC